MVERQKKRCSLAQQVTDQLQRMIEEGVWQVGEKIPTELELTEMFSVSRNTLREAVRSLASVGILEVKQGDGTYVRANNSFHAHMSMVYTQVPLQEILEAQRILEIAMARLAARYRTAEEVQAIHTALELRRQQEVPVRENTRADVRFHLTIAHACHNRILDDLYTSISAYLEAHGATHAEKTAGQLAQIDQLHEELFRAIQQQDPVAAGACAQNIVKM